MAGKSGDEEGGCHAANARKSEDLPAPACALRAGRLDAKASWEGDPAESS